MSNIYIQEPPTNGKVLLKTTAGDIDIELWSKEAPKACRNFIQLCLEAYYDNTIFHRVVPGFIVQGGDPTGTGTGGESIYGAPFKDEFHSRLRFNRRGLVAMANAGPHDNGSQFFFTLGRADELNNKHTIFGKITGDTVYNMLRLTEVDIDDEERPRNPHKIKCCEVLFNPFDDIIPREIKKPKKEKPEEEVKKLKPRGTKNFSLLSFGEEAEEEEEEVNRVSQSMKGKSKSSHDLLKDDPHLSSVPAVESEKGDAAGDSDDDGEYGSAEHDEYVDGDEKDQMRERIAKKLKKGTSANVKTAGESEVEKKSVSRSEELRKEARQLKRELLAAKQKKMENAAKQAEKRSEEEEAAPDGAVAEYRREKQKYEALRKQQAKKGTSREDQTLALLNQFKSKLTQAIAETPENDISETEVEDDEGWMSHVLQFEDKSRKVKDASMQDSDTFEIYDPRNPVNKRRREESKKLMREKKERR
ncbi:spliceosome-associated protein CWC27 homolog isoform X1 [Orcinus orca]|uniref:Spliceosome-associated protein CWC27 homolog n=3 Tax=Delphinidae TaxID=9726 RepID=A0A2U4AX47_TURTR|nr:spliceosome-associated protein CWC27 homolog isoform X1 [Orcinus orca]XP_019785537.1 spliceosome-associated protein CWC27 homolog isoform X1 [Tursiops truncatus]XP_026956820.1 spliceosome-associated protein CWC27 homolog isoform X1 [Lagenorhynchus obliquidens]XP_030699993.1 spliceosome-associated protein CWC27 homolog [Globicephala melas]XP_059865413.1 spliceosome-associated protein CWC27 homolog [Delphinus delphis]XP_059998989.1 spliceosome-associated protein CWC27 homolog isoform X1 [Lage